jgi:PilZ domain
LGKAKTLEKDKTEKGIDRYPRYPFSQTVTFEVSTPLTLQKSDQKEKEGSTRNVSEGGLCFVTERALEESQIIKIKIPVLEGAAAIPTLAKVQWVKKQTSVDMQAPVRQAITERRGNQYVIGLRFIL